MRSGSVFSIVALVVAGGAHYASGSCKAVLNFTMSECTTTCMGNWTISPVLACCGCVVEIDEVNWLCTGEGEARAKAEFRCGSDASYTELNTGTTCSDNSGYPVEDETAMCSCYPGETMLFRMVVCPGSLAGTCDGNNNSANEPKITRFNCNDCQ